MNTTVNFKIAKLLREKGFDENCRFGYNGLFEPHHTGLIEFGYLQRNSELLELTYSAPTIAEVVCWIYSKYQIWIQVKPGGKLETWDFITQKKDNTFAVPYFEIKQHKPFFNSPTEAYSAAIDYTLNNLI